MPIILPRADMTEAQQREAAAKNTEAIVQVTVAQNFKMWMQNFSANLPAMWTDNDIADIPKTKGTPAIVIGGGPSLRKFNHLEVLAKNKFKGTIFCSDSQFKRALSEGVKVDYVVNLDSSPLTVPFIADVEAPDTSLILTSMAHPQLRKVWRGGPVYWFVDDLASCGHRHSLADGLAVIANKTWSSSGANVGGACVNLAWFTGHSPIGLIGMDLGYDVDEPLENTPYYQNHLKDFGPENVFKAFRRGHNPYWNNDYYIDYVFEIYRNEMLNRVQVMKMPVVNCSGQGSLYGEAVISMNFSQFLKKNPH